MSMPMVGLSVTVARLAVCAGTHRFFSALTEYAARFRLMAAENLIDFAQQKKIFTMCGSERNGL
jgi:hypothetical protein